jgi:hypothetical protein
MSHLRIWFDILSSKKLLLIGDEKILSLAAFTDVLRGLEVFGS